MKCVYHPSYQVALPPGHPFPMSKYLLLKDQLLAEGILAADDILQAERSIERAAVVDLDVHQGNGTAAIFEAEDEVFTFSMHGERNYPLAKMRSNLDVPLKDGVGDAEYLGALQRHLPRVLDTACADIVFYLAGVDVAAGDRYGKLALTEEGIRRRDQSVIEAVRDRGLPLVIVLAGGYAATRGRTAELHAHVFREAVAYERRMTGQRMGANAMRAAS